MHKNSEKEEEFLMNLEEEDSNIHFIFIISKYIEGQSLEVFLKKKRNQNVYLHILYHVGGNFYRI